MNAQAVIGIIHNSLNANIAFLDEAAQYATSFCNMLKVFIKHYNSIQMENPNINKKIPMILRVEREHIIDNPEPTLTSSWQKIATAIFCQDPITKIIEDLENNFIVKINELKDKYSNGVTNIEQSIHNSITDMANVEQQYQLLYQEYSNLCQSIEKYHGNPSQKEKYDKLKFKFKGTQKAACDKLVELNNKILEYNLQIEKALSKYEETEKQKFDDIYYCIFDFSKTLRKVSEINKKITEEVSTEVSTISSQKDVDQLINEPALLKVPSRISLSRKPSLSGSLSTIEAIIKFNENLKSGKSDEINEEELKNIEIQSGEHQNGENQENQNQTQDDQQQSQVQGQNQDDQQQSQNQPQENQQQNQVQTQENQQQNQEQTQENQQQTDQQNQESLPNNEQQNQDQTQDDQQQSQEQPQQNQEEQPNNEQQNQDQTQQVQQQNDQQNQPQINQNENQTEQKEAEDQQQIQQNEQSQPETQQNQPEDQTNKTENQNNETQQQQQQNDEQNQDQPTNNQADETQQPQQQNQESNQETQQQNEDNNNNDDDDDGIEIESQIQSDQRQPAFEKRTRHHHIFRAQRAQDEIPVPLDTNKQQQKQQQKQKQKQKQRSVPISSNSSGSLQRFGNFFAQKRQAMKFPSSLNHSAFRTSTSTTSTTSTTTTSEQHLELHGTSNQSYGESYDSDNFHAESTFFEITKMFTFDVSKFLSPSEIFKASLRNYDAVLTEDCGPFHKGDEVTVVPSSDSHKPATVMDKEGQKLTIDSSKLEKIYERKIMKVAQPVESGELEVEVGEFVLVVKEKEGFSKCLSAYREEGIILSTKLAPYEA